MRQHSGWNPNIICSILHCFTKVCSSGTHGLLLCSNAVQQVLPHTLDAVGHCGGTGSDD